MVMRRTLGTLVLLLGLVGCGESDDGGIAVDECDDGGDCAYPPVLVSGTAGGGEVSARATELADDAALAAYVEQFSDSFGAKVRAAVDRLVGPPGGVLVAAVVSIGCDVPPGAVVRRADHGIEITPQKVVSPMEECLAPVTTVALAAVPDYDGGE